MKFIDLYAKNLVPEELKYLSEGKEQLKELAADRFSNLKGHFRSLKCNSINLMSKTPSINHIPIMFWSLLTKLLIINQFITSVGLEMSEEEQNLPYLYWTLKLHKSSYKHWFIAGSSNVSVSPMYYHPPHQQPQGILPNFCLGGRTFGLKIN